MQFLAEHNLEGVVIGLLTFFIIGLFHPLVIKGEYHFGVRCWWVFLIAGIIALIAALMIKNVMWSAICGVVGFSSFWSIGELFEQRKRVDRGWFPRNPKRKDRQ